MTMGMQALSGLGLVYIILIFCRCILKWGDGSCGTDKRPGIGIAQTTGSRQVQADVAQIWDSSAGLMAVIADGIGSANTGKVCAQVAADAILDRYEPYCELNDPIYFFRTSFLEASQRIQRTIGERRGGASTGAVFINRSHLYYAVAGDIRVAVMRGGGDDSAEQGARRWMFWRRRPMKTVKYPDRIRFGAWRRKRSGVIWDRMASMR